LSILGKTRFVRDNLKLKRTRKNKQQLLENFLHDLPLETTSPNLYKNTLCANRQRKYATHVYI